MVGVVAHFGLAETFDTEILFAVDPGEPFEGMLAKPLVHNLVQPVDMRVGFLEMFDGSLGADPFGHGERLDPAVDAYSAAEQLQRIKLVQRFFDSAELRRQRWVEFALPDVAPFFFELKTTVEVRGRDRFVRTLAGDLWIRFRFLSYFRPSSFARSLTL